MTVTSRREFVAALLGAPLALSACHAAAPSIPDGELLLPGKVAGHRLRDATGARVSVPPERWRTARVAIVGSGVAGLAAAWWLERAGLRDVVVLELDDVVGGTSQAGASSVTAYPWGAHYIVAPQAHQASLIALLGEIGALEPEPVNGQPAPVEEALCREPEERLYYRGRWYDGLYLRAGASAEDLAQLARFQAEIGHWVAFRDSRGRRAFALPASTASDAAEVSALDRLSFGSWLAQHGFTSERLLWLADYACRDDYGLRAADTSAWAGVAYFAARIRNVGDEPQPIVTWPQGNARLITQLSKHLGPRLLLGHGVVDVSPAGSGLELTALSPSGPMGVRAERVIVATPHLVARRIVAALRAGARNLVALDRGAWAVANLHLDARPRSRERDAAIAWDNVFYDSPSLGYVVATHQSGPERGPTVLTWYYPFTGDGARARQELDGASREQWAAAALADIGRAHPDLPAACRRIDVAYWGHGMVRPRPGSIFDPALRAARAPLGAVHFAVSELSGVALFEEALDHGVRAADEVLQALGQGS
jgi:monoamine oxidase